jgi:hypothetical protein
MTSLTLFLAFGFWNLSFKFLILGILGSLVHFRHLYFPFAYFASLRLETSLGFLLALLQEEKC